MAEIVDDRKTGVQPLPGLRGLNQQREDGLPTLDQLRAINRSYGSGTYGPSSVDTSAVQSYKGTPMADWGRSGYDENMLNAPMSGEMLNDTRYENQPWYDVLANGVGKMLGTAGTTFLSSLVALPYGLASAAVNGDPSKLWNNDVTKVLADVDDWLESSMTNYQSEEQKQAKWWQRLGDMNWWADDVIKNMGFTMGAAASGALGAGALGLLGRTMGVVNNISKGSRIANNVASALFSATGEGMIEARQGVEERNKLETQRLEDALAPQYNALDMEMQLAEQEYQQNRGLNLVADPTTGRPVDAAYLQYRQKIADIDARRRTLDSQKQAGIQQIEDTGAEMGNKILLGNQVLLTAGNLIQFGKLFSKSFDNARHMAEITAKTNKPLIAGASRVGEDIAQGYKTYGKRAGQIAAGTKGILTEGSEEMNQQWIQNSAGYSVNREDVNDYWKAKLDPEAYKDTTQSMYNLGEVISQGFKDSWGDIDQWEQFVIGGFTGMAGTYMPTKIFNQDTSKSRLNPLRYGEWAGGAVNEIRDYNERFNQYQENIDDLNKVVARADFPTRLQDYTAHTALQKNKEYAALADDKKLWKDEDDKQTVHDIQAFLRAGKLDDLRAMYNEMGKDLSDAEVEEIVKATTREISVQEDENDYKTRKNAEIGQRRAAISDYERQIRELDAAAQNTTDAATLKSIGNQRTSLLNKISEENNTINTLIAERDAYKGKKKFISAYTDAEGNRTKTNDEIRQEIKHNAEELNRKLDSYLDSIAQVQEDSGGRLSKDQEDNLAYLHNIGKESEVRFDKIMANIRASLPKKFYLKTSKTPEQLSQESVISDLAFSKDDSTPEGFVEVDTSAMTDRNFGNFFMKEVMWGGNINPDFGRLADEIDENLSEDEKAKKATRAFNEALEDAELSQAEQRDRNWKWVADNFMNNYKQGRSQKDAASALNTIQKDIKEASDLLNQAGNYRRTLAEYMANPNKVEEDKAAEEERLEQENLNSKFEGKSPSEINEDIANGTTSKEERDSFFDFLNSNPKRTDAGTQTLNNVKKSKDISNEVTNLKQSVAQSAAQMSEGASESDRAKIQRATEMANEMINAVAAQADDIADLGIESFSRVIEAERAEIADPNELANFDPDGIRAMTYDLISGALNKSQSSENKRNDIPDDVPFPEPDPEEVGKDSTTKTSSFNILPQEKKKDRGVVISAVTPEQLSSVAEDEDVEANLNTSGTWRSTTRRYGRRRIAPGKYETTRQPYHEVIASDKDQVKVKRSKAVHEYMQSNGVYDIVENPDQGAVKMNGEVHFMVKDFSNEIFGKPFEELSEEDKPKAIVVLMLNDRGQVIGDLPLAQYEPNYLSGSPTEQVKSLMQFQDFVFKAFEENKKKTGAKEAIVDSGITKQGADNLNLKFKNNKPFKSFVTQVLDGIVPYGDEINTINDIAGNQPFKIGITVTDDTIATALKSEDDKLKGSIKKPKETKVGRPYLLLKSTSGKYIPVPFYTPAFDAAQHSNTDFYRVLSSALKDLLLNVNSESYKKNMDIIEALLQVKPQDEVSKVIERKGNSIKIHLQDLIDPNNKIELSSDNADLDATVLSLIQQLSGTDINVSLSFINKSIKVTGVPALDYNQVIGSIANANLPKNTTHTQNSWFTVAMVTPEKAAVGQRVEYRQPVMPTYTLSNGTNVVVDPVRKVAYAENDASKTPITDNDEVNLLLARTILQGKTNKEQPFSFQVGKNMLIYDPKQDRITKKSEIRTRSQVKQEKQTATTAQAAPAGGSFFDFLENPPTREETDKENAAKKKAEEQKPTATKKSLEETEKLYRDNGIISRQTTDAWNAIPKELKLKMINEGTNVRLSWGKNSYVVSTSNLQELSNRLKDANIAAKRGTLKVEEAPKTMQSPGSLIKEKESAARKWLAKNLPMLNSEERVQFVEKLSYAGDDKQKVWGTFKNGVIQILRNAPEGTVYHEAFHYVMDMVLNSQQRQQVLDAAKEHYGNMSNLELEERLAEDFRRYSLDENAEGIRGRILRWIRRIKDLITRYNRIDDATVNQLFWKINNGEFASTPVSNESYDDYTSRVAEEIHNARQERIRWKNLTQEQKYWLRDAGLSEVIYNDMTLDEKEQWIACRT